MKVFVTIVLDGVGIGAAPDAGLYGDDGSDTLGHVCEHVRPDLPNLSAFGLGNIRTLAGIVPAPDPRASYGKMREVSAGKDSTSGHWELAGLVLETPFPTYPVGFPRELLDRFLTETGSEGVLGNRPESGTAIIAELGDRHLETGFPIVYTSADSVFQVAAHVGRIPLDKLYRLCQITRERVCIGEHAVGRVIARPFSGSSGSYTRISEARHDYSVKPTGPTVLDALQNNNVATVSIGKVSDLFAGEGFTASHKTKSNAEGIRCLIERIRELRGGGPDTFLWVNLVDFDQEFGHRNDPEGFGAALEAFDRALPEILDVLPEESRLVITADHGNDPTTPGTDHNREYVPLLYFGSENVRDLGIRSSFCDHAATVATFFGVPFNGVGPDSTAVKREPFE